MGHTAKQFLKDLAIADRMLPNHQMAECLSRMVNASATLSEAQAQMLVKMIIETSGKSRLGDSFVLEALPIATWVNTCRE